jgi:3-(3-hydroxy-phenyl)propionate hydroxylase
MNAVSDGAVPGDAVAVVGAGPVGQTVALLLARYGVPTVVLDARERRDAIGSRSICQQREALDIWSAIPCVPHDSASDAGTQSRTVGDRVAAEGVTWSRARTFFRDGELFTLDLSRAGWSPYPPFVNISQTRTEQILDEAIAASPLVEVRWGWPVTAIRQDAAGVTLTCRAGPVRAPYAVVCAGGRADKLRHQLGVSFEGESFDELFLICDIRTELGDWAEERRFYFDPAWNPGRQVLIHPCPDSTYRIDWQVPAGFDLAAEEASGALDRRVRAVIGDRGYDVVWQSVYRFSSRVASRLRVGRVLLAGDTAHVFSPFGARGLNSGVADADNLAWKLAYVLRGWAPPELLESYHDERHAAALENLDVTASTMRFLVPPDEAASAHRQDVLSRAGTEPSARAQVDSGRLSEPFWYDASPLTSPSAAHPCTGRPPRGRLPTPGPGILLPDAPLPDTRLPDAPGPDRSAVAAHRSDGGMPEADAEASFGRSARRLRELTRDGLLALSADPEVVRAALAAVAPGPSRVLPLDASLADVLGARPNEIWLVRPDAYVAAVVNDPGRPLTDAIRRALGHPPGWSPQ